MIFKVKDLVEMLDESFLFDNQEDWDNSGIQIGDFNSEVKGIMFVMDVTVDSILFAISKGINCIISHHPLFFDKIDSLILGSDYYTKLKLIYDENINIISIHTPLDLCSKGISKALADRCKIVNQEIFIKKNENIGYGIKGTVKSQLLVDFAVFIKKTLNLNHIILYYKKNNNIKNIAVLGGSGAFSIEDAISQNIDLLISSDFKYHDVQKSLENNLSIIDLGHFESEFFGIEYLCNFIRKKISYNIGEILVYDNNLFKRNII